MTCPRSTVRHTHSDVVSCGVWAYSERWLVISVVLSFTGRHLTADQVCRIITILTACGSAALPDGFVARSLRREAVFFIPPAPHDMIYWSGGGFTTHEGKWKVRFRPPPRKILSNDLPLHCSATATHGPIAVDERILSSIDSFVARLRTEALTRSGAAAEGGANSRWQEAEDAATRLG